MQRYEIRDSRYLQLPIKTGAVRLSKRRAKGRGGREGQVPDIIKKGNGKILSLGRRGHSEVSLEMPNRMLRPRGSGGSRGGRGRPATGLRSVGFQCASVRYNT